MARRNAKKRKSAKSGNDPSEKGATMDILNDYTMLIIFKMLHPLDWLNLSRVSHRWNKLSSLLWGSNLCLSTSYLSKLPDKIEYSQAVLMIKNAATVIRNFKSSFDDHGTLKVKLGAYEFTAEGLTEHQIIKILSYYAQNISTMNFEVKGDDSFYKTKYFKKLVRSNTELKTLRLNQYSTLVFKEITSSLEHLTLNEVSIYDDLEFNYKMDYQLLKKICPELKSLDIKIYAQTSKEANDVMNSIARCAPKVVNLNVRFYSSQRATCQLLDFVLKFPELQKFKIAICKTQVSYKVIKGIAETCRDLKVLDLDNLSITVKSFSALLTLPKLEKLSLADVANLEPVPASLPSLRKLSITFSKSAKNQKLIKWDNLFAAIQQMPNLRFLGCLNLPEEVQFRLVKEMITISTHKSLSLMMATDDWNQFLIMTDTVLENNVSWPIFSHETYMFLVIDSKPGFMDEVKDYIKKSLRKFRFIAMSRKNSVSRVLSGLFSVNPFDWDMMLKEK